MGTLFTITLYAPDKETAAAAANVAFDRVGALEEIMSDYQADSELMRLCDQPAGTPVPVSADLFNILERARQISELSHGAFDVTLGPFVRLWRFSRKRGTLPSEAEITTARASIGFEKVKLDRRRHSVTLLVPNMRLDLGGIAKGYAADEAMKILKGRGLPRALVAASGDIAVGRPPPGETGWKIAITQIGESGDNAAPSLLLHDAGISTSGDTEQSIEIAGTRYSHIVDPATGVGLTNRVQVTVISRNATTTDALATAICVLGPLRGLPLADSLPDTAAIMITKNGSEQRLLKSKRFDSLSSARPNWSHN